MKPSAVNKVKEAIRKFVAYVEVNGPGTQMYLAWQEKNDLTRFVHLFISANEAEQARHGQSEEVNRFESVYSPKLVGGEVVFTDYELISGKPTPRLGDCGDDCDHRVPEDAAGVEILLGEAAITNAVAGQPLQML